MPRAKTDSFIASLPLRVSCSDDRALSVRLEAFRHVQNAATGECLRILDLMRESKAWRRARKLPKKSKERSEAFRSVIEHFDFKSSMAERFAIACKNACWIKDHLSSNETQKAALRAFKAVAEYSYGKRGRPKFKRFGSVDSVEGKTNAAGIRWKADAATIEWSGLTLRAFVDRKDAWLDEALKAPTKYCRLVRREIRGKTQWSAQLIQSGLSPRRHPTGTGVVGTGVVGIDIGPSTIAAVSDTDATLERFCPTLEQPWKEIKRIQRAMDRSRRAGNPDCFNADGTWKKGARAKNRSVRYQQLAQKKRERERRLAAERKRAHGELVTRILANGSEASRSIAAQCQATTIAPATKVASIVVQAERLSYKAFQKMFGRSATVRGCGSFMSLLRRRATGAGGTVFEFSTRSTKLSQFDHTTGDYVKKPLSQRIHVLRDGSGTVQRDLYSAFLARFVGAMEKLDARKASAAFPVARQLLVQAASSFNQATIGVGMPHPNANGVRVARLRETTERAGEAVDDVTAWGFASGGEGRGEPVPLPDGGPWPRFGATSLNPPAFRHHSVAAGH